MRSTLDLTAAVLLMALLQGYAVLGYKCPTDIFDIFYISPCTCDQASDAGITVTCNNTNLGNMSLGLNSLAVFKLPIEKLTLYRCNIARLVGDFLYKLSVSVLYIVDTPIEKIDELIFVGVNETLNELYIHNSSLAEFPKLALRNLGKLAILQIDHHNISSLPKDAFGDTELAGKLLKLQISNGNLSELPIESLQPLRKLKTLDLHGNKLKDLKRNQFKGLRDVEMLDLSQNNIITTLDGSHIADLTKMYLFNISHNSITELTRDAFTKNPALRILNISHNRIKKLNSNLFKGMKFLMRVYLSNNLIGGVA